MSAETAIVLGAVSLFCVIAGTLAHHTVQTMLENAYRKGWRDCRNSGVKTDPDFQHHDFH